jgi:hypothetical protein
VWLLEMIGGVVASQKGNCTYGRDRQSQMFIIKILSFSFPPPTSLFSLAVFGSLIDMT